MPNTIRTSIINSNIKNINTHPLQNYSIHLKQMLNIIQTSTGSSQLMTDHLTTIQNYNVLTLRLIITWIWSCITELQMLSIYGCLQCPRIFLPYFMTVFQNPALLVFNKTAPIMDLLNNQSVHLMTITFG